MVVVDRTRPNADATPRTMILHENDGTRIDGSSSLSKIVLCKNGSYQYYVIIMQLRVGLLYHIADGFIVLFFQKVFDLAKVSFGPKQRAHGHEEEQRKG